MYDIAYLIQCILFDNRKALSLQPYSRKAKDLRLYTSEAWDWEDLEHQERHAGLTSQQSRAMAGDHVLKLFSIPPRPFWPRRGRCDQQCNFSASEFATLEVSGAAASSSAVPMKRGRKEDPGDEVQAGQEKGARIPKTGSTSNPTLRPPGSANH